MLFYNIKALNFTSKSDKKVYIIKIGKNIIKNVCIIYDETVSYILNGADLMLKGVLNRAEIKNSDKNFSLNEMFYVQTVSGAIVAIGITLVSKETMNVDNPTGKFLRILHRVGDSLWSIGTKKELPVLPIQQEENKTEEIISTSQEEEINTNKDKEEEVNTITSSNIEEIKAEEEEDKKDSEGVIENIPPQEEIDEHFDIVFLTLCKLQLQKEKFPMDPGKLYQQFMKPLSEEIGLFIDIKHSSYKKINNYFKHLHKDKSMITFSKAKGQNNDYIQSINWDCEEIKTFKPRVKKIKFLSHQKEAPQEHENILLSKGEKIEVQILYRPNQKIKILFPKYLPDYVEGNYYSLSQCTEVLKSYLKDNSLFIVDQPGMAKLDATLEKILSVHYDKFQLEDRVYKMEDILEMWKRNLNEKSCIMRTNNEESEEIFTNNLQIRIIAKKMNNKNVTLISGLDKFIDINQATKSLAKHFATSVTIKDEIAGLKNTIFIQGYWVNELVSKLVEEFKINKKIIKVEDRLKSKVKKK